MTPSDFTNDLLSDAPRSVLREDGIEYAFIGTLQGFKYEYRRDITNRDSLKQNKFQEYSVGENTNSATSSPTNTPTSTSSAVLQPTETPMAA